MLSLLRLSRSHLSRARRQVNLRWIATQLLEMSNALKASRIRGLRHQTLPTAVMRTSKAPIARRKNDETFIPIFNKNSIAVWRSFDHRQRPLPYFFSG